MTQPGLYSAVWRWHFYAGLFILPFMMLLSVTGGVYLFKDEVNALLYRELLQVNPQVHPLAPSEIVRNALGENDAEAVAYMPPASADVSARVVVKEKSGESRFIFVDPYRGTVLGEVPGGQFGNLPLMSFVRSLHSLEVAGWFGNGLIEVAAGWALILVLSGAYLWWPRGARGGVLSVRWRAGRRTLWRDIHAVTGAIAGFFILFLALTGLPWSGLWGEQLKDAVNGLGWGYPPGYWFPVAQSGNHLHDTAIQAPWTLENMPLPLSGEQGLQPLGLDAVIAFCNTAGMPAGYTVNFPMGPSGVWSASAIPDKVQSTRTMHLDQYTGAVLFDAGFSDLGPAGKAIEWGVSVHTGQQFGRLNQVLMLLTCMAIFLMSIAAAIMWWTRRPSGGLGAPRPASGFRVPRGIAVIPVIMGLAFPLVGLSILLVMVIDAILPSALRARLH